MRVIAALLVVAPLLGGITLEPLHLLFSAYGLLIWSALFVLHLPLGGAWPWDQHVGAVCFDFGLQCVLLRYWRVGSGCSSDLAFNSCTGTTLGPAKMSGQLLFRRVVLSYLGVGFGR
jgi:hypothetical protein